MDTFEIKTLRVHAEGDTVRSIEPNERRSHHECIICDGVIGAAGSNLVVLRCKGQQPRITIGGEESPEPWRIYDAGWLHHKCAERFVSRATRYKTPGDLKTSLKFNLPTNPTQEATMPMPNRNVNATAHETGKEPFFAVLCLKSDYPVTQTFDTAEEAMTVAEEMARKHDGHRFHVVESIGCAAIEKPVVVRRFTKAATRKR